MPETPQPPADPLLYSLNTLRLKHQDAKAKAETAKAANQDAADARADLEKHLAAHIEQLKKQFDISVFV